MSHGKQDLRPTLTKAEFVPGGTIGPVKGVSQGVWFEMSLEGGGVEDELDGLGWVALVDLEPTR